MLRPSVRRSERRSKRFRWPSAEIPLAGKFGTPPVPDIDGIKPDGAYLTYDNLAEIKLDGLAATASEPARVWGALNIGNGPVTIGNVEDMAVESQINFEHVSGVDQIAIKPSNIHFGEFTGIVEGAIGPETLPPGPASAANPGYQFELTTKDAKSAPANSPVPALPFDARLAGRYDLTLKHLDVSQIEVLANKESSLSGNASVTFGGGSPAMNLDLQIPQMPVADVKQLWPIWVATGARPGLSIRCTTVRRRTAQSK